MKAEENQVYAAAMQFCRTMHIVTPETVMFGYAKLLSMDEKQVQNFVSEDCMDDLEVAHKWFSDNKLDLNLIKSSLSFLVPLIPYNAVKEKYDKFADFLRSEAESIGSGDILKETMECAVVPFLTLFAQGSELQAVFAFQAELKEKFAGAMEKEQEEKQAALGKGIKAKEDDSEKTACNRSVDDHEAANGGESGKKEGNKNKKEAEEITEPRNLSEVAKKYRNLSAVLFDVVKGQDHAIIKFVQGFNQGELLKRTEERNQPRAYFFFFGPPGVGKTFLAETAAEAMGIPHKTFNMSEYVSPQSVDELIGVSSYYVGGKESALAKFVRENPECLLIFDEIEKANIAVLRLFLQILGSGKIRNVNMGNDVDFRKTTIIFTSNVGQELYGDRTLNLSSLPEKVIVDAILNEKNAADMSVLPPELCSRIASGNTIMFNHHTVRTLSEMVRENFDKIVAGMKKEYGIDLKYSRELPLLFLFNRGGEIDARVATGQSGIFLKNEIYELMRQLENSTAQDPSITEISIGIDWKGIDPELQRLFKNEDKAEVLVFSENEDLFADLQDDRYVIHCTSVFSEAFEMLKYDISAIYIDPFFGTGSDDETVLSISDYNTDGVRLFHNLMEKQSGVPVFMLEIDRDFSDVDRRTFLQEGAAGTVAANSKQISSFKRQFGQIMEELYMERESQSFGQRGWVLDFNTKQELKIEEGAVNILFYDLKKRMAVDVESRGSILSDAERPNVRFSDIIGAEDAQKALRQYVGFLQNPKKFINNGGKPPKGVLLYGPPGTGKTMLAKAMAGESDVAFLETSASEFKNKYVGESEANIRRIFAKARKYAPAIIFIDEIDAIGKKRTGGEYNSVTESMLNALLTEMDGFSSSENSKPVFVLAATNYGVGEGTEGISSLDEALIRRFNKRIYVDLPRENERKTFITSLLQKRGIDSISERTTQSVAERTTGKSLAYLEQVMESAIENAMEEGRHITDDDLLTSLENYAFGEKKEHTPEYYKEVAIHETGHAYVSYLSGDKPSYITIESRGNFGGYMQHSNKEEVTGYTREELLALIRTCLAGRAAEQVFFGREKSLNTGASSDLQRGTDYAWNIVCTYGMEDDSLVVLNRDDVLKSPMASEYVAKVDGILKKEMENTIAIIEKGRDKIQEIADALVRENRLMGEQFEELMKD